MQLLLLKEGRRDFSQKDKIAQGRHGALWDSFSIPEVTERSELYCVDGIWLSQCAKPAVQYQKRGISI